TSLVRRDAELATHRGRHTEPREGATGTENGCIKKRLTRQLPCKTPTLHASNAPMNLIWLQSVANAELRAKLWQSILAGERPENVVQP
ncbi:hypothetical protein, partial [Pseudomonas sp.]|uniref:hypothetical protein n=1 Tax=Pseudomonas sp. TaxID=306 RepID=UPI0040547A3A